MKGVATLVDTRDAIAGPLLQFAYDPLLVILSVALAALSSFVTLRVAGHLRLSQDEKRQFRLVVVGGLTLGGGVWAMHFTGMLAASLPVEVTYDLPLTVMSLLLPIASSGAGLHLIRPLSIGPARLAAAGTMTGMGIVAMHYTGMAAMRAPVDMAYLRNGFVLSIAVAIAASIVAFWFARRFSDQSKPEPKPVVAIGTAMMMACAISSMHYIAMAATVVGDRSGREMDVQFALDPHLMAGGVVIVLLFTLIAAQLNIALDDKPTGRMRLAALPLLMAAVAATAGGIAMTALYDTALRQERAELLEMARAQRALIEAVARFDARHSAEDFSGDAMAATLSQVREAHDAFVGFGRSGEFYFGRSGADAIDYVVPLRFENGTESKPSPDSDRVMRLALAGMTGTTVGPDYRGERVLAAYTPIPALGLGLVVKVDMAEMRAPFLSTALMIFAAIVLLIAAGFAISRRISLPVVHELDEKARLEIELEFARAVQANLLPGSAPEVHSLRCAALMEPARFVSGDFYDFIETDDETVAVIIGDVTGKGVSAALLMARILTELRNVFLREHAPDRALAQLNRALHDRISHGMFATVCCLLVHVRERRIEIANAGHLPLLLRSGSGTVLERAYASGPPVGILEDAEYLSESLTLAEDEVLLAYTDGGIEPRNPLGELYGVERLQDALRSTEAGPEIMLQVLRNSLDEFSGKVPRADDLTLVAIGFEH